MVNNIIKHLYIHIPFCKEICTYCDFYRTKTNNDDIKFNYINKVINEIKKDKNIYKTIYIGGGTPNYLDDKLMDDFLSVLSCKLEKEYEFTIECNPEFISEQQISIFKKNNINRISLGVQTLNENILKLLKRTHKNSDVINSLELLQKYQFDNISIDLIYNLPLQKNVDIYHCFDFIKKYNIKHISFYSLEIKEGSILNKRKYKTNLDVEENQFDIIKSEFEKINYKRYEVSNWALSEKYYSKHNIAYWDMKQWKGIGVSSYGFENNQYYCNIGNIENWEKVNQNWTEKDLYENIFIMGLRKIKGIDLKVDINKKAFEFLKNKLNFELLEIKDNFIKVKNVDLLHNVLLDII